MARSQKGNNNCYCQDNELTWIDWNLDKRRERLRNLHAGSFSFAWRTRICIGGSFSRIARFAGGTTEALC